MDEELFLPVLSHFENGNFWTASGGALRYKVVPDTGGEPQAHRRGVGGPLALSGQHSGGDKGISPQ